MVFFLHELCIKIHTNITILNIILYHVFFDFFMNFFNININIYINTIYTSYIYIKSFYKDVFLFFDQFNLFKIYFHDFYEHVHTVGCHNNKRFLTEYFISPTNLVSVFFFFIYLYLILFTLLIFCKKFDIDINLMLKTHFTELDNNISNSKDMFFFIFFSVVFLITYYCIGIYFFKINNYYIHIFISLFSVFLFIFFLLIKFGSNYIMYLKGFGRHDNPIKTHLDDNLLFMSFFCRILVQTIRLLFSYCLIAVLNNAIFYIFKHISINQYRNITSVQEINDVIVYFLKIIIEFFDSSSTSSTQTTTYMFIIYWLFFYVYTNVNKSSFFKKNIRETK